MRSAIDPDKLRRDLEKIVGARRVSIALSDLRTYSRDMWPRLMIALREGDALEQQPNAVVWPENTREVAAIVRLARSLDIAIVPYGGGSGVCGGAVPVRGGITIDLKRMDGAVEIDSDEMVCSVEAGINGERFERELQRRGFTFGNFPSSIYCSTVGGWLATRAAGQMSTKYGKVEDRVIGLTMVSGRGDIVETDGLARANRGPNWTQLILGSEGTLGVITSARLRLSTAPALRVLRGFELEDVEHGVEAMRRVMQRGLRPAVVRLYNELDTFIHGLGDEKDHVPAHDPRFFAPVSEPGVGALPLLDTSGDNDNPSHPLGRGTIAKLINLVSGSGAARLSQSLRHEALAAAMSHPRLVNTVAGSIIDRISRRGCLLIVGVEGARIRTEVEARMTFSELERAGAKDLGEDPGRKWLEHRYSVSYKMSKAFRGGAFVDTMEVASSWERLLDLYQAVRDAISRHALVMAHFSHAYADGCSIYFSFAGFGASRQEAEHVYDAIWRDGMHAATRAGGTISHHHGVGLLKAPYMVGEHRESMRILQAVKSMLDPGNIMNPGKLGLPLEVKTHL